VDHLLTSYFKRTLSKVKQAEVKIVDFLKKMIFLLLLYDKNADSFMDKDGISMTLYELTNFQ
jgi:hypothetical protein